ncbi:MAG: HAD family hydrolase [Proteobacteria bacterium]|nr:HAD family hydrolase [Pseudomonadota bacterium]HQR03997.1 HAD family hydrolase [Rhodocyclaceae bacterium]
MWPHCIAFDFDGTLVDSAPGVLSALAHALTQNGMQAQVALTTDIIGPPLRHTLALISGTNQPALLDGLAQAFKQHYDSESCRLTPPYPGIVHLLDELRRHATPLLLVTNKRGLPTRLILSQLSWLSRFVGLYCLDEHPDCADKAALLTKALHSHEQDPATTPYVGDTEGDAQAAAANGMPMIWAAWGYGGMPAPRHTIARTPDELWMLLSSAPPRESSCPAP